MFVVYGHIVRAIEAVSLSGPSLAKRMSPYRPSWRQKTKRERSKLKELDLE